MKKVKINENHKFHKLLMAAVALLLVVCLAAGLFVEFGSALFVPDNKGQELPLLTDATQPVSQESATIVTENAEELLARPTGGKDNFVILEIVPSEKFATWGYYIGGQEPDKETVARAANWNETGKDGFIGNGYTTPFRVVVDGTKVEYLPDKAAYDAYATSPGKKSATGGYKIVLEKSTSTGSGYFENVGAGRGLYKLTTEPVEEYIAEKGGDYNANFDKSTDLYNSAAVVEEGYLSDPNVVVTDYNYDAVLVYDRLAVSGYFVESIAERTEGEYVIDHEATSVALGFVSVDDPAYEAGLTVALTNQDYRKVIFKLYEEDASASFVPVRYDLVFGYESSAADPFASYVVDEDTVEFNPGEGEFLAKLTEVDGSYYTAAAPKGTGEYNIYMTSFVMTADGTTGGSWVWHAETLTNGKQYSTKAEYESGKLYTPDLNSALGEATYQGVTAKYRGYYVRNSYVNNEYFKVLSLGIGGYDGTQTEAEKLAILASEETKKQIRAFDATTKIEIITKMPGQVTQEDLDVADFIYISTEVPLQGLVDFGYAQSGTFSPSTTGDLANFAMVRDIYVNCVNKDIAFMVNAQLAYCACPQLKSLYMLFTIFEDPTLMVNFLERKNADGSYSPIPNNGLNYIETSTGQMVKRYSYQRYDPDDANATFAYDVDFSKKSWSWGQDFEIYQVSEWGGPGWPTKNTTVKGWKLNNDNNSYVNFADGTNRWLIGSWYGAGFFGTASNWKSIYLILRQDIFNLVITNASYNTKQESVIYVDEFDEKYPIFYKMQAVAVLTKLPEIQRVQVFYDSNSDGIIDPYSAPIWEAVAAGIASTPGSATVVTDPNAIALNYSNPQKTYEGYDVDVKSYFGTADREKCFIVRVVGRKNAGTTELPVWIAVEEQQAVTLIIRDMFILN